MSRLSLSLWQRLFGLWLSMLFSSAVLADTLPSDTFPSTNGPVYATLVHQGVLYIGGNFSLVGGDSRNGLAAIELSTGAVIQDWNPGLSGIVYDMKVSADGCNLYVAGAFSGISSVVRNHLGAVGVNDLCDDYSLATPWNPNVNGNGVYGIALTADGKTLYAGGDFTNVATIMRSHLVAVDTVTAAVTPWNPSADAPVRVVKMSADDNVLYVGGDFSQAGGQLRKALAALSPANNQALTWNPLLAGGLPAVYTLALNADGSLLYLGGDFNSVNSSGRNNIAVLNTADALLSNWNPGAGGVVRALLLSSDEDRAYVGGDFVNPALTGGVARDYLLALDTVAATGDATAWTPVLDARVRSLVANGDTVFVGGDFSNVVDSVPVAHQGILSFAMTPPVTTVDVAAGAYQSGFPVTLNCLDDSAGACAGTWYTTDDSDPHVSGVAGSGPVNIVATTNFKFYSIDNEGTQETVQTAVYAIDSQPPSTSPLLPGGSYSLATISDITLSCVDNGDAGCDKIYYTLTADGSTSPIIDPAYLYSGPIAMPDGDSVLKYFSVDKAGNPESVNTDSYNIDRIAPLVTPSFTSGTYTNPLDVVLSCADVGSGCGAIYYTIDGTPPAVEGVLESGAIFYSAPITISQGAVLRVFALDVAGNNFSDIVAMYSFTTPRDEARQSTGTGAVSIGWLFMALLTMCLRASARQLRCH